MDHVAGLEAWERAQRVNSACGRHCVNPVCSSGSLALLGRRVWLWCAPSSCSGATLLPSLTEGRAGLTPMGAKQHKSLKGKLPWSQLYQMFLFFVAKGSSLCSDLSFGSCAWAVLLGLVAKKRLSFSSCLTSTFWL